MQSVGVAELVRAIHIEVGLRGEQVERPTVLGAHEAEQAITAGDRLHEPNTVSKETSQIRYTYECCI